jgi:hypothetical protein
LSLSERCRIHGSGTRWEKRLLEALEVAEEEAGKLREEQRSAIVIDVRGSG